MAETQSKAKAYQRIRQKLTLFHLILTPAVLAITFSTSLSLLFKEFAGIAIQNPYGVTALYFLFFSLFVLIFDLPLSYYSGFVLEHRFELSNQTFKGWVVDLSKKLILSFGFSLALLEALYFLIWKFPEKWWLYAWAAYAVVTCVVGKLFPVVIIPLFYKYGKVEDETLKKRIFSLADRYGLPIRNVYSLNLSKTTKKANAAFMGMGKTKRVVLSDTLIEKFSHDEIETVVAHELGHFKHRDIWKQLIVGLATSFATFWIAFMLMNPLAERFGFGGVSDIAALPVLFLLFYLFSLGLMPVQNGFSRWIERAADRFALEAYPQAGVFVSCMNKLAEVNLADPEPNALYEWLFFDHPSIGKRIQMARAWEASKRNQK